MRSTIHRMDLGKIIPEDMSTIYPVIWYVANSTGVILI